MMKLKILLLSFSSAVLCANAFAAPPSDASLDKWMELRHFDRDYKKAVESALDEGMTDGLKEIFDEVPDGKRQQLAELIARFSKQLTDEFFRPEYIAKYHENARATAKSVFTQKEIDAMNKFYRTPEGQSVLEKMPVYEKKEVENLDGYSSQMAEEIFEKYAASFVEQFISIWCGEACFENDGSTVSKASKSPETPKGKRKARRK